MGAKRHIASATKTFTSTLLGLLVEEGKCQLDDPAKRYEPGMSQYYPKVTLRHLATNTSRRHEVVLPFVNDVISSVTTPVRELQGFQRIYLDPGQSRRLEFVLTQDQLALYDVRLKRVVEPGTFEVMVGDQKGKFDVQ